VTTVSKTLKADERNWGEPVDLVAFGRALAERRAAYEARNGAVPVPRNSGKRRTASKKALLRAIAATGKKW
jgi:hypothetical protein